MERSAFLQELEAVLLKAAEKERQWEPTLGALLPEIDRWQRLQRNAEELTKRVLQHNEKPLLFGFLVVIKDTIHVDGLETRAGSQLPPSVLAGLEAPVVKDLKAAGALLLGKAATSEFAHFEPSATRNPVAPGHTPGGSSSGPAAAVAAGLCDVAVGTQTIGSISRPAAYCGVVGFKPSKGRVSLDGVIPCSPSIDQVGFFSRSIEPLWAISQATVADWRFDVQWSRNRPTLPLKSESRTNANSENRTGANSESRIKENSAVEIVRKEDLTDEASLISAAQTLAFSNQTPYCEARHGWTGEEESSREKRSLISKGSLDDKRARRLGVPNGHFLRGCEEKALEAFERTLERLAKAGHTILRLNVLDDIAEIDRSHRRLEAFEFAEVHQEWYKEFGALYRPKTVDLLLEGQTVSANEAQNGRQSCIALRSRLGSLAEQHALDAWIAPAATGPPPLGLGSTGDPRMTVPWSHSGLPTVTLCTGHVPGASDASLPVAITLAGRFGRDEELLCLAEDIQRAVGVPYRSPEPPETGL